MKVIIHPSTVSGEVVAPPSKSLTQRAYAAALLHTGNTVIQHAGKSKDENASAEIIRCLGAKISFAGNDTHIRSDFFNHSFGENTQINCGESGLATRMFTPVISLLDRSFIIKGEGSLLNRPMDFFENILPEIGVNISSANGRLPLHIHGPLQAKEIRIDGSLSSQFLTGLLFAFGKTVKKDTVIIADQLKSKPYIDLTLDVMEKFGYHITHENYERFLISPKAPFTGEIKYHIEGDWSNAAFLLIAGAVAGSCTVRNLANDSLQADGAVRNVLDQCGVQTDHSAAYYSATKKELNPFNFDATDCPDLFPPLAALALHCKGKSVIKGTSRLHGKESDRAKTLKDIFEKMGASVLLNEDEMIIDAPDQLKHAIVSSHGDHRIAMAAAIAGLAGAGVIIEDAEAVEKSYPDFYENLEKLNVTLQYQ